MKPKQHARKALSPELLERTAVMLRQLAHPDRLRIIEILEDTKEAPVHEIMTTSGLPQSAASQHLTQMKRVGLLNSARRGKEVWYSIADPRSLTILDCIRSKGDPS